MDYGSKIEFVPDDPVHEGYTFDGWYKEADCVNAWDFENDLTPKKVVDDDREVVYQETVLYAKWTEI